MVSEPGKVEHPATKGLMGPFDAAAQDPRPRVIVVGGGFVGLAAVKSLRHAPVQILLIDRRNHHLFQPLLYQVATALLPPATSRARSGSSCGSSPTR
jgi:NADH dehydrogenase FAD-containing subunit